jgi:hypothetical protein
MPEDQALTVSQSCEADARELAGRGIRRHLDGVVSSLVTLAASRRGQDDVLAIIAPRPEAARSDPPASL